jgi:hypothetical protein
VSRSQAAIEESLMTPEEAIGWAEKKHAGSNHWPTRRWRVETKHVGNSRLLGREAAKRTHKRYGGELVELIPTRTDYLESKGITGRRSQVRVLAEDLGECPWCGVEAGQPCKQPKGALCRPHASRARASAFTEAAKDLGECPVCKAGAGEACRTPGNRLRNPHVRRTGRSRYQIMAADLDTCPHCKAAAGEVCTSKDGTPRVPHVRRRQK